MIMETVLCDLDGLSHVCGKFDTNMVFHPILVK